MNVEPVRRGVMQVVNNALDIWYKGMITTELPFNAGGSLYVKFMKSIEIYVTFKQKL